MAALLPGGVLSNAEMFELQRHIGRPFTWTALLTFAGSDYHEQVMAEHVAARASGVDVWPQVSCRPLVFQMNLAEPFSLNTFPNFAALMDAPVEERIAAYRDPAWREATQEQLESRGLQPVQQRLAVGGRVGHAARTWSAAWSSTWPRSRASPPSTSCSISRWPMISPHGSGRCWPTTTEDGIAWLLPRDDVLLGLADSGAHVSQLCDACFATDLLGNWVRDREVMTLEHAVHKLTAEPARCLRPPRPRCSSVSEWLPTWSSSIPTRWPRGRSGGSWTSPRAASG